MTLEELALSRITVKFKNSNNFRNLVRFATSIFDKTIEDVDLVGDLKNIDSEYSLVLDEIGKLLGIYPRPKIATGLNGEGFLQLDISKIDVSPFASENENLAIREATNNEYKRVLKAYSSLSNTRGTIGDWVRFYSLISDSSAYILNKGSEFDIIIKKDFNNFEKAFILLISKDLSNLTVNKNFLGTTSGGQPFQFDVSPFDSSPFVKSW